MKEELLLELKAKYPIGNIVVGKVIHHMPFGIFLDIKHPLAKGLIQITDFLDEGVMSQDQYPAIGEMVEAVVLEYVDNDNNQIWLSMKPSVLEKARQL